jgi:hypothetical protein
VKIQGSLRRILESIYKKGEKMDAQWTKERSKKETK